MTTDACTGECDCPFCTTRSARQARRLALEKREESRPNRWWVRRQGGWRLVGFRLRIDGKFYANGSRRWRLGREHGFIFGATTIDDELDVTPESGRAWARKHRDSLKGTVLKGERSVAQLVADAASIGLVLIVDGDLPGSGVIDIVSVWARTRRRA